VQQQLAEGVFHGFRSGERRSVIVAQRRFAAKSKAVDNLVDILEGMALEAAISGAFHDESV
jgi:hypothetical protein